MILVLILLLQPVVYAAWTPTAPTPPPAPRIEEITQLHGRTWSDPYHWMRKLPDQPLSPTLANVINHENAYTEVSFESRASLENVLLEEMQERLSSKISVDVRGEVAPVRVGKKIYFYAPETHAIRVRTHGDRSVLVMKLNSDLVGSRNLVRFLPSPQFERVALLFRDAKSEVVIVEGLGQRPSVYDRFEIDDADDFQWAWDQSGKQLMYVDPINDLKSRQVAIRAGKSSKIFFESPDDKTYVLLNTTRDDQFVRIEVTGYHLEYPIVYDRAFHEVWRTAGTVGTFAQIESFNGHWILKSTESNRFSQVYRIPQSRPSAAGYSDADLLLKGSEAVDYAPQRNLEENTIGLDCFQSFCMVQRKTLGKPELVVIDSAGKQLTVLQFKDPYYYLQVGALDPYESTTVEFDQYSLLKPKTRYRYTLGQSGYDRISESKFTGVDESDYLIEQVRFKVWDGTEVPVTLIQHRNTQLNSKTPFFVQAYGAYATDFYIGYDVAFNIAHAASLLDRGVVFAMVHVRGGGELGHHWYLDGNRNQKYNSVRDFKSVLETLIARHYTSAEKIAIGGFSAGGIIMGNALNDFPYLFKAALIQQGFLDMLNSQLDPEIPFVKLEWSIWGNPSQQSEFSRMWKMDPYQNLRRQAYPAVFIRTSVDDSTVLVHEGLKFVSKLRQMRTNTEVPTYLQVLPAGVGAHDGRYQNYEIDVARNFTFILDQIATP